MLLGRLSTRKRSNKLLQNGYNHAKLYTFTISSIIAKFDLLTPIVKSSMVSLECTTILLLPSLINYIETIKVLPVQQRHYNVVASASATDYCESHENYSELASSEF